MSNPKIKPEELSEDINKVLNLISEVNNIDPEDVNINKILQKINKINKELKNKYKNLDTEK